MLPTTLGTGSTLCTACGFFLRGRRRVHRRGRSDLWQKGINALDRWEIAVPYVAAYRSLYDFIEQHYFTEPFYPKNRLPEAVRTLSARSARATAAPLAKGTGLTPATVNKSLAHLERIGVVAELTNKQRGRVFSYARYIDILNEGMALPGGRSSSRTKSDR